MAVAEPTNRSATWRGALSLRFAAIGERTFLAQRTHEGPFCVQRAFYPGDGACHVYLLHPPGGLAGGDELALDVDVARDAAVLLTTPAATKFYRSDGPESVLTQAFRVAAGASLEWLPLDTILFGGSRTRIATDVYLDGGARFMGWELTSLGRPLSGDHYSSGTLTQRTQLFVDGDPQLIETLRWRAGDSLLAAPWGLDTFRVCGALYAFPADNHLLAHVRERMGAAALSIDSTDSPLATLAQPGVHSGATLLDRLLVIRSLARDPEELRMAFEELWQMLRVAVVGRSPSTPRIWRT